MKVLLIRHAHAVDGGARLPDDGRWLTAVGRQVARAAGERLRGQAIDAVLTSPLVRAVQTAELVAQGAGFAGEIVAVPSLSPEGSVRAAAAALDGAGAVVVAVGHEPGISMLAAHLAGRPSHASFRKGQVVIVEDGRVTASIDPDLR